jgi:poly(3-hydroxybutyrate) depolymerase
MIHDVSFVELAASPALYMGMGKQLKAGRIRSVMVGMALVALAACQNGNGGNPMSVGPATPQRGSLIQSPVQKVGSYSVDDLLAMLGVSELGKTLLQLTYSPLCTISVYHMEYETVDPAGNLTPASGALMVPSGTGTCQGGRPIVLYAHGTVTDRDYNIAELGASDNDQGLLLAAVFAAEGYIVVAPNYVGYDTSTLGFHPYLDADQQSADMIDALTAARSALPASAAPSTTDGGKLFITGYSQGGFVAMATQRAMQAAGMTVTAAAPLSGPYALSAFADAVVEGEVSVSSPENFVMLVTSYQDVYGNIYTATTDMFNAPYAAGIATLLPSTTPLGDLESAGKIPTSELFSSTPPAVSYASLTPATAPANLAPAFALGFGPDYLIINSYRLSYLEDAQSSPDGGFPILTNGLPPANPQNGLRQDLKTNDLRTWAPAAPVLLCAGNSDPTVFYLNTELIQGYWAASAPSAPVTVLDIDSPVTTNDPYAALKHEFVVAKDLVIASAVAGGATDGGALAVLQDYHGGLVPPFCFSAARSFFDAQ